MYCGKAEKCHIWKINKDFKRGKIIVQKNRVFITCSLCGLCGTLTKLQYQKYKKGKLEIDAE